ncbi:MAG: IS110 family transposase [Rubrivivax sp.]|nr:IS110 family transposase [Rubrivivax sp.]
MTSFVGIDVSKRKLDVALLLPEGRYRLSGFGNDAAGFAALARWLDKTVPQGRHSVHTCMEATGTYHEALALWLHEHGVKVSLVNPAQIKHFLASEMVRHKTDGGDAQGLARFAQRHQPAAWVPPTPTVRALQALVARVHAVEAMRQSERNRLDVAHESVRPSIQDIIASLERTLQQLNQQIEHTIDDDPDLHRRQELLDTIPGLGTKTIPTLLAYIGEPSRFTSVKALIAYCKLAPCIRQSGSSLDKRRGTHPMGRSEIKRALYFPAMVAGQHNPLLAVFWQRMQANNKPGKLVVEACMHKLLSIAFGVLRSGRPFDPAYPASQRA